MTTHGTIAIRRKTQPNGSMPGRDEVYVLEAKSNGYYVDDFAKEHETPTSVDELVLEALEFLSSKVGVRGMAEIFVEVKPYEAQKTYSDLAVYTVYFNGRTWEDNKISRS